MIGTIIVAVNTCLIQGDIILESIATKLIWMREQTVCQAIFEFMMVCIFEPLNLLQSIFCQIPGVKYLYFGAFKSLYYSKCFQEHHQEGDSLKNTVPVIIQQINLICSARLMNFTSDSRIQTKTSKTSLSRLFAVCIHFIFNFLFMINLKKTARVVFGCMSNKIGYDSR